ncbi:hypothetical protein KB879_27320 [Cupriavidus sp. KK10]|jgi:hypothetical protein|uniref:hypothetical protein n=1 Tax=Cupriavidus sp. KK10 TaxID=1478019 RepID=UPI001BA694F8|nr:hypothetical protein [Cupriavidus sp. KK10]QUN27726.1 hypothetical protein KB879_27320 [Cupriavidus sp. KK10]
MANGHITEIAMVLQTETMALVPDNAVDPVVFKKPFGETSTPIGSRIKISEHSVEIGQLNGESAAVLFEVEISGFQVILESGTSPHADYDGRKNLKTVKIFADTLIIKSPFRLPQTNVVIFARIIKFINDGRIESTPPANTVVPAPANNGTPSGGSPGLSAGDITCLAGSIDISLSTIPKVLLANGANGQPGGAGTPPAPGTPMPPVGIKEVYDGKVFVEHNDPNLGHCGVPVPADDPNMPYAIVYFETRHFGVGQVTVGQKQFPGDGIPGVPGGLPGQGGNGGAIKINKEELSPIVDNSGGLPGTPYIDVLTPGPVGTPNPSYHVYCGAGWVENHSERHDAVPGPPAQTPHNIAGPPGSLIVVNDELAWVHPRGFSWLLIHGEDLFFSRMLPEANDIFSTCANTITRFLELYPNGEYAGELSNLLRRSRHRLAQLALGMDYFGKPLGWIPLLSLEVSLSAYREEKSRVANAKYLSYWLGETIERADKRAATLHLLLDDSNKKLKEFKANVNNIRLVKIPLAQHRLAEISALQELVYQQLLLREQALKALAEHNAEQMERAERARQHLHIVAVVLTLIPVIQPAGAMMGAAIEGMADNKDILSIVKNVGAAYLSGAEGLKGLNDLVNGIDGLDFSTLDSIEKTINEVPAGANESRGRKIVKAAAEVYDKATEFLEEKSKSTVSTDLAAKLLAQYEAADPEFQQYSANARALLLAKQEVFAAFQDLQQFAIDSVQAISEHVRQVDLAVTALREAEGGHNSAVLTAIREAEISADRRLRYYLYLVALAYEYRLLKPYTEPLLVELHYEELVSSARANNIPLTLEKIETLMEAYDNILANITESIVHRYLEEQHPIEHSQSKVIALTTDECVRLGRGESIVLNPVLRPEFQGLSIEELRLLRVDIPANSMVVQNPPVNAIDVLVRHSGVSRITSKGTRYGFRHIGYDGKKLMTWRTTVYLATGATEPQADSEAEKSLFATVLKIDDDNLNLFAAPGLDADLVLSIEPSENHISISQLYLRLSYTFCES